MGKKKEKNPHDLALLATLHCITVYDTLSLPKVNTTKYGLNSFRYFAAKQWNSIPNELRLRAGGLEFNKQVRNIQF